MRWPFKSACLISTYICTHTCVSVTEYCWHSSHSQCVFVCTGMGHCDFMFANFWLRSLFLQLSNSCYFLQSLFFTLMKYMCTCTCTCVHIWGEEKKNAVSLLNFFSILQKAVWCVCFYGNSLLLSGSSDGSIKVCTCVCSKFCIHMYMFETLRFQNIPVRKQWRVFKAAASRVSLAGQPYCEGAGPPDYLRSVVVLLYVLHMKTLQLLYCSYSSVHFQT